MTKEFSLVEAMNDFIARPDDMSIPRPGLWPSESSVEYEMDGRLVVEGKCHRAVFYRMKNYPSGCKGAG